MHQMMEWSCSSLRKTRVGPGGHAGALMFQSTWWNATCMYSRCRMGSRARGGHVNQAEFLSHLIFGSIVVSILACHAASRVTGVQFPAKESFLMYPRLRA